MPESPSIRPLAAADGAALLAWRNDPSAYRWFRDSRPLTDSEHDAWMSSRLADDRVSVWVAVLDGVPLGCVRLDPEPDGSAEVSIVVDPTRRGMGVGGRLLDHCIAKARGRQLGTVVAEIHSGNAASLALFTGRGFTVAGEDGDFVLLRLT